MKDETNIKELLTKDLMTVPNAISFIRILLITPFVAFFVTGNYIAAAVTVGLSGLSDCFDGMIARRFHQESELGKILDPLADKLTLIASGVCLIMIEPYLLPLMLLLVAKDVLMLIGGTIIIKKGIVPPKSAWYGKLSTILFYASLAAVVVMAVFGYTNKTVTVCMLAVTAFFMIYSLVNYTFVYFRLLKESKENGSDTDTSGSV